MVTKRKKTKRPTKRQTKGQTKKDLEKKIAQLEAKLTGLTAQTKAPPPPKAAPPPPPKPAEQQAPPPPPKPAEQKAAPPASVSEALEDAWRNYPLGTSPIQMKAKTTGFIPASNRYWGRMISPIGTAPTQDWNIQKKVVTGYTACSNQYFATRARLAYHPTDKKFNGYGLQIQGVAAQQQTQSAPPPPPPPEPQPQQSTSSKSSKQSELEAYEADYMNRLEQGHVEQEHIQRAAEELAAKRMPDSGGSSGQTSSKKGALPKGF